MLEATLGPAQHHEDLTIFPILADKERDLPYGLMAESLAMGILTIGEKDGGTVPTLMATNTGIQPILILDGEQLIGARQNRMTNRSIILPPNSITEIPVSCMEQGRWHFRSEKFTPAPQHAPSKVRKRARETEAKASHDASIRGRGARPSHRDLAQAQGAVWEEIRAFEDKLGRSSESGALDSVYETRRSELNRWVRAFPRCPDQVGLLAFHGKAPLGMDAVGSPALYGKIHERFLTGYVLDAMEGRVGADPGEGPGPDPSLAGHAEESVERMRSAERTPSESVGMGEYRILSGHVVGSELVDQAKLVHLSAFPADDHAGRRDRRGHAVPPGPRNPDPPLPRPSQRRRRY